MIKNKFFTLIFFLPFLLSYSFVVNAQNTNNNDLSLSEESSANLDNIDTARFQNKAVLQILNKTTAKTSIAEIAVGSSVDFNNISIKVNRCWQAPLEQKPDSRILLEIFETKVSGEKRRIFFGWMISSSPSISSLEHPVYDVTAISCKSK